MIATFFIEIIGAIYVFIRYKASPATRLIIAILVCLAVFQLAEFFICEVPALPGLTWARVAHIAITLLPPLGILLAMHIASKPSRVAQFILYIAAIGFITYFLFVDNALNAHICAGNYVIFESVNSQLPYAMYYYGLLGANVSYCFYWAKRMDDAKIRSALNWLTVGYLAFILPTTTINLIEPTTIAAIPSIMCGFAILLALILIFAVLPKVGQPRRRDDD